MGESNVFGVSLRGAACIMILFSYCGLAIYLKELAGLKELGLIACGYLFGKQQGGTNAPTNSSSNVSNSAGNVSGPGDTAK